MPDERAKYSADDRRKMAKSGAAMADGSYPIGDEEDLRRAISAVGRGSGSHDAIRRHIMKRARALGHIDMIPDNWNPDGSLKEAAAAFEGGEVRTVAFTLREDAHGDDGLTLEGYAAIFNSPTAIRDQLGEYDEVIVPGAFKRTIAGGRPVMQFDHGTHPVLGSMPIGAIKELREDVRGLYVQARVFDNWMTEPLRQAIGAQAVPGMSFKFTVPEGKDKWTVQESGRQLRTVHEIKLFELGPVVHPAYKETSVALRALVSAVPGLTLTLTGVTAQQEADADPAPGTSEEPAATRGTSEEPAAPITADPTPEVTRPPTPSTADERKRLARQIEAARMGAGKIPNG